MRLLTSLIFMCLLAGCVTETVEEPTVYGHFDSPRKAKWSLWHKRTESHTEYSEPMPPTPPPEPMQAIPPPAAAN